MSKGYTIIEILVALAIFALLVSAIAYLSMDATFSSLVTDERSKAVFLAKEGLEASRSIRDNNWTNLSSGIYGLSLTRNHWEFSGSIEDISSQLNGGQRQIIIEDIDENNKKITSTVTWQISNVRQGQESFNTILSNWHRIFQKWSIAAIFNITHLGTELTANANDLFYRDDLIYLVTDDNLGLLPEFFVIDVADESNIRIISSLNLETGANSIYVYGNYAYIATNHDNRELMIIDISNSLNPQLVGFYDLDGRFDATSIYIFGNYAAMGTINNRRGPEFYIFDIQNPYSIVLRSFLDLGDTVNSLYYDGSYIYAACSGNTEELQIIDLSNILFPQVIGTMNINGAINAYDVFILDNHAYLVAAGNTGNEFYVVDITNKTSPNIINSFEIGDNTNSVFVDRNYAFLGANLNKKQFQVIDISDVTNLSLLSTLDIGGNVNSVVVNTNTVYLATDRNDGELVILKEH